ncbi:cytochrome c oxidase subunit NDUFA4 [Chaetodon trifascialis]|uniref:cytochrome c oxidase subunit NDUFA4 n=1 Tax=Chaetodon trifascialis TaxID=109706 RepID=UPI0039955687
MSSMLGVVAKQLKNHPALIPLFIFIGGGATMSMMYLGRLALKNPDVSWDRKNNPEPWNKLQPNQQYKLFAINMDYSKMKKDRPDF